MNLPERGEPANVDTEAPDPFYFFRGWFRTKLSFIALIVSIAGIWHTGGFHF